jgi:hypothetical protein
MAPVVAAGAWSLISSRSALVRQPGPRAHAWRRWAGNGQRICGPRRMESSFSPLNWTARGSTCCERSDSFRRSCDRGGHLAALSPMQSHSRQGPPTPSAASHESCVVHAFAEREDTANGIDFEESAK